jgi:nucleotide-binding universal stress UspA family protein
MMIKKIIVPTDFSDITKNALKYSVRVARVFGAEVHVLHVVESYEHNVMGETKEVSQEILKKGLESKMEDFTKEIKTNIRIKWHIKRGKIYKEIDELAEEIGAHMIVMGTHGSSGLTGVGKLILGTNAYKTVNYAPCPVMTMTNTKHSLDFENILLPLDVTKTTQQKVDFAIKWGKAFNSTIHLLSVTTFSDEYMHDLADLDGRLKKIAKKVKSTGLKCKICTSRSEQIVSAVNTYAEKNKIDLTIIMTRQEKKWNEYLVGSRARRLVITSKAPVLSLQPRQQED